MMLKRLTTTAATLALSLLAAAPALAHGGAQGGDHASLLAGLFHPLTGADHLLAMTGVGLWAGQQAEGTRRALALPAAFLVALALGFGLAMSGLGLPLVEPMIAASVVAFGLLGATALRLPLGAGLAVSMIFALFHGFAHGVESTGPLFAPGFLATSATLLLASFALARNATRAPRLAALAVAGAGLGMVVAG